jgi:hypothetical protein
MLDFLRRLLASGAAGPLSLKLEPGSSAGDVVRDGHGLRIEHDDWGTAEFVHQSHLAAVEKEMRAISAIDQGQDTTYGGTDIYLRNEIKEPLLPAEIPLKALHGLFPRRTDFKGVSFWGGGGGGDEMAERSFAFSTDGGLTLYGDHYSGNGAEWLRCICFGWCDTRYKETLASELAALAQFAARHHLYLICRNQEFCSQPDAGRYLKFFEQYK